ncbi:MAG: hypothetical protein WED04_07315 [Promethearchaeati archaeon SRVP18_Atabeyarchaeia-1]
MKLLSRRGGLDSFSEKEVAARVISPTIARRLAIACQRLAGLCPPATSDGIVDVVRDIGYIKIDPIDVVGGTWYIHMEDCLTRQTEVWSLGASNDFALTV